jgi:hypothetical protein
LRSAVDKEGSMTRISAKHLSQFPNEIRQQFDSPVLLPDIFGVLPQPKISKAVAERKMAQGLRKKFGSPSKFKNKKTMVGDKFFASKKEAKHYCDLLLLEKSGEIKDLKTQVKFVLQPSFGKNGKGIREIAYISDFTYSDKKGAFHVVDVKGMRTDVYKIKKKMFEYVYMNYAISEV